MLRKGICLDSGEIKVNFNYLDESNYFDVFENENVFVKNCQVNYIESLVNYVIRTVIVDDRALDRQISFIADTRNKRRCTKKQLQYLSKLLEDNFIYILTENQLKFLSHQRICVISKLIDLFKNTEIDLY